MSTADEGRVKIFRFDPAVDREPRYETYNLPNEAWNNRKVIDVIRYIYENFAPGLSFRELCRQQVCGSCMVRVNSKPVLTCDTIAQREMVLEPLAKHKIIKDLVVELPGQKDYQP